MTPETAQQLLALTDPVTLQQRLVDALGGRNDKRVVVGIAFRGRTACASTVVAEADSMPVGCIMKLFVSALAMRAVRQGRLRIDDDVEPLLAMRAGKSAQLLQGTTLAHLLEHTHGLDASQLPQVPRAPDGRIDIEALCAALARDGRLAAPGLLYSYGNAGPWLCAALLESCHGVQFAALLKQLLQLRESSDLCPSQGGGAAVAVNGLLRFLLQVADTQQDAFARAMTPLPGWNSQEQGIRLGWKEFAPGWHGHNSALQSEAGLVRLNPQQGIAIAMSAVDHSLSNLFARLFGSLLPELASVKLPRQLSRDEARKLDLQPFRGTYGDGALRISIERPEDSALQLRAQRCEGGKVAGESIVTAALRPARDNVFFTVPVHGELFPYLQFLHQTPEGFRYLWNGRSIWPLIEPRSSAPPGNQ